MRLINFIIKHFDSQVILFIEKSLRKLGEVRMADGNKIKINQETTSWRIPRLESSGAS